MCEEAGKQKAILIYKPKHRYCFSTKLSFSKNELLSIAHASFDECFDALIYNFLTLCADNDRTFVQYKLVVQPSTYSESHAEELIRFYPVNEDILYDDCSDEDVPITDVETFVNDSILYWLKENYHYADRYCILLRLSLITKKIDDDGGK